MTFRSKELSVQYRRLGSTALPVPVFSLGTQCLMSGDRPRSEARHCLLSALERGIHSVFAADDTDGGRALAMLGDILADLRVKRSRYCLTARIGVYPASGLPMAQSLSRKRIHDACDLGRQALQTDYLDCVLCDRPGSECSVIEVVDAIDVLINTGKLLYWGVTDWSVAQLEQAWSYATAARRALPNFVHLDRFRAQVNGDWVLFHAWCQRHGLGVTQPMTASVVADGGGDVQGGASHAMLRRMEALGAQWGYSPVVLWAVWCLDIAKMNSLVLELSSQHSLTIIDSVLECQAQLSSDQLATMAAVVPGKPISMVEALVHSEHGNESN